MDNEYKYLATKPYLSYTTDWMTFEIISINALWANNALQWFLLTDCSSDHCVIPASTNIINCSYGYINPLISCYTGQRITGLIGNDTTVIVA